MMNHHMQSILFVALILALMLACVLPTVYYGFGMPVH